MKDNPVRHLLALASGLLFGLGLLASGMTDPTKVQGFLDVGGAWDPSLALVMGAAVAIASLAFAWARHRKRTWLGDTIDWPQARGIDGRLLLGGALFGAGWGLAGFCPGPALVAMASGLQEAWIFGAAMLAGMAVHDLLLARNRES